MSFSKREVLKLLVVVLLVSLLALTIYVAVPQVQENRSGAGSNGSSESSTLQSAEYWWSMLHTMAMSSASRSPNSTPVEVSQTVPLTNQTIWTLGTGGVSYAPAVGDGEVFVVTVNKILFAVNASTGAVVWLRPNVINASGYVGSPAFADGEVFVGSSDGSTCALDAATGALLWSYPTGDVATSSPNVADGVVYVGSGSGSYAHNLTLGGVVYALNASTGALVWNYTVGSALECSPAVADGAVFVSSADNGTYALNASTGAVIWTSNIPIAMSFPAVVNGVLYVGSQDSNVYALNATTGAVVWNYTTGGSVYSSPAAANGMVYVGSWDNNRVYALNATTGALVWNYTTGGEVVSSPAIAGGVVYVGSFDNNFYALNATSGALIWSYNTGYEMSSPVVDNDVVYVGSSGNLYAFGQPPFSVSISPFSAEIDVGQPQVFSSIVTGGALPYTFQWYLDGAPVSRATNASWTFTPASAGSFTVYLEVTDNVGTVATSTNASLIAAVPPIFSILNPGPESYPSGWSASPTVRYAGTSDFEFYSNETSVGSTFFVNVTVTNVTNLYAWGIGLTYDNTTLQFVNAWLPTDNVFSGAAASGATLIQPPVVVDPSPYNSSWAVMKWGCTYIQGSEDWCFNGTGTLAQLEFRIIRAAGSTMPQITSSFTFDPNWTTVLYWPDLDYRPEPLLGTASFAYIF